MSDAVDALTGGEVPPAPATEEAQAPAPAEQPGLTMPGKDATPEQWGEFYKSIGAPEKAEDYEVSLQEGEDPATADVVRKMFKEANILPNQAAKLLEFRNRVAAETAAAQAKAQADAALAAEAKNKAEAASLQTEWGDKHTENLEYAKRAVNQFLPKEQASDIVSAIESKIGYAATIKLMHSIGKGLGEHDAAGLGTNNGKGTQQMTADERLTTGLYGKR